MAVEVEFIGDARRAEPLLWKSIAEAVLMGRSGHVTVRDTPLGWKVCLVAMDSRGTSARHPHRDGDFEMELRSALRAAGFVIAAP